MKEIRTATIETTGEGMKLVGRPIVYDTATTIHSPAGDFIETIAAGALDEADLSDVRLLYNHDTGKVPLARTPKTMQLNVDSAGLTFTAVLPDTEEARSVYEAVKRGDLSGMSFGFTVEDGGDEWNGRTRTIKQIRKLYECSIVPFPAYPTASIQARSALLANTNSAERIKARILVHKILKKGI